MIHSRHKNLAIRRRAAFYMQTFWIDSAEHYNKMLLACPTEQRKVYFEEQMYLCIMYAFFELD